MVGIGRMGDVPGKRLRRVPAGLADGATTARIEMHPALRDGLAVGVLGGYTTFSTLMYQSLRQFETGSPAAAVFNLTGSVAIGIVATLAGVALGRTA